MTTLIADATKVLDRGKMRLGRAKADTLTEDELLIFGLSCVLAAFIAEEEARWGKAS